MCLTLANSVANVQIFPNIIVNLFLVVFLKYVRISKTNLFTRYEYFNIMEITGILCNVLASFSTIVFLVLLFEE
jgi:hypothetical protein